MAKDDETPNFDALWVKAKLLPHDQYTVILLKYAEGLSLKEISTITEKPINTVKTLLHRAKNNLSKTLHLDDIYVH